MRVTSGERVMGRLGFVRGSQYLIANLLCLGGQARQGTSNANVMQSRNYAGGKPCGTPR